MGEIIWARATTESFSCYAKYVDGLLVGYFDERLNPVAIPEGVAVSVSEHGNVAPSDD